MPIINATVARALVADSETRLDTVLTNVSKQIEEAATQGKSVIQLQGKEFEVNKAPFYPPQMNPFQIKVKKELEKHGYMVRITTETITVGGGFKSLDEEPRQEDAHYYTVSW